jgi:hypothetical protein
LELQHLGWNALTVAFYGTIIFTFISGWGQWEQFQTIRRTRSGQSLSVFWIMFGATMMAVVYIYGLHTRSIALMVNGAVLGVGYTLVLWGLSVFKGLTKSDKRWAAVFALVIFTMAILPSKTWFFLLVSFSNIAATTAQPYEMWKNKNAGVVNIRFIISLIASTLFWVVYAFSVGDLALQIICPAFLAILVVTAAFWFRYRNVPESALA